MKILIDTNVLLSAAFRDRLPERVIIHIAAHDDWRWLVTPGILREYTDVLQRPRFRLSRETLAHWHALLDMRTIRVDDVPIGIEFPRDPKDTVFLAAALATEADFLITGDQALLALGTTGMTRIVTVASFAREFAVP